MPKTSQSEIQECIAGKGRLCAQGQKFFFAGAQLCAPSTTSNWFSKLQRAKRAIKTHSRWASPGSNRIRTNDRYAHFLEIQTFARSQLTYIVRHIHNFSWLNCFILLPRVMTATRTRWGSGLACLIALIDWLAWFIDCLIYWLIKCVHWFIDWFNVGRNLRSRPTSRCSVEPLLYWPLWSCKIDPLVHSMVHSMVHLICWILLFFNLLPFFMELRNSRRNGMAAPMWVAQPIITPFYFRL